MPKKDVRRRGRPPVTGVARNSRLSLRLTAEEHALCQERADGLGLSLADWVRAVLTRASRRKKPQ
jgi:predicted HicB family RNase H-like nuclease